jgi:hypothetical protein
MNIEKYNMVERQLICCNIRESRIIDAFLNIDRENFVPSRYKKFAYVDIDIATSKSETFMLRPHTLSRIVQRILQLQPERLLVVGDNILYTLAILKCIFFGNCSSMSEEDLLRSEIEKFDLIFFDSKIYSKTTISHGKFMLENSGRMIFFAHSAFLNLFDLSDQASFIEIDVIERTYNDVTSKLFSTNVLLRER